MQFYLYGVKIMIMVVYQDVKISSRIGLNQKIKENKNMYVIK